MLPGDKASDLEYTDQKALHIANNGSILRFTDRPSSWINTTLLPPYSCSQGKAIGCSLGANRDISIDARGPKSTYVERLWTTKLSNVGPYGPGENIEVVVTFNERVAVSSNGSAPALRLNTGAFALYKRGSGTENLTFIYSVEEDQHTPRGGKATLDTYDEGYAYAYDPGESRITPLDVIYLGNDGWIRRYSTNPTAAVNLRLPSPVREAFNPLKRVARCRLIHSSFALFHRESSILLAKDEMFEFVEAVQGLGESPCLTISVRSHGVG